jgi:hypothetical protein
MRGFGHYRQTLRSFANWRAETAEGRNVLLISASMPGVRRSRVFARRYPSYLAAPGEWGVRACGRVRCTILAQRGQHFGKLPREYSRDGRPGGTGRPRRGAESPLGGPGTEFAPTFKDRLPTVHSGSKEGPGLLQQRRWLTITDVGVRRRLFFCGGAYA